jgi:hypothetical protein
MRSLENVNQRQSIFRVLVALCVGAVLYCWTVGVLGAAGPKPAQIQPTLQLADQLQQQLSAEKTLTDAQINRVNRAVPTDQQQQLSQIGRLLAADPKSKAAQRQWQSLIGNSAAKKPADIYAIVKWVLRDSYLQASNDLKSYAEKVKAFNELKKRIRAEITRARTHRSKHSSKKQESLSAAFTPDYRLRKDGLISARKPVRTKSSLAAYIDELEGLLASTSEDEQLANVDLQNMLQKQQQTMQMLTNISKMLHDTAMAVIRKIGG